MKYRVEFCFESGGAVNVEANSQDEAEQIIYNHIEFDDMETLQDLEDFEIVHREYWTQGAEEIKEAIK